jgi:predicted DNA-binding transcriptional regulator YafY
MADPALRLLRLLGLLQRRSKWSGADLAQELGVEPRSIRRDIDRLRGLGYHVEGTPGSSGGYRLTGGNDVPPMLFEDDEAMAVAVVLGLSAGAALPGMERSTLSALAKLDRLLPPRLSTQLNALRAATVSLVAPTEVVSTESLISLAQACDNNLLANFSYCAHDGRQSERRVEPHRLVASDRRWYLVAYDLDRADWRTFRVDRATAVKTPGHTFVPRELDDPARMVAEAISTTLYEHRVLVRVESSAEELARHIAPYEGVVDSAGDGSSIVELGADNFDWLAGYLVGLGITFEVLEPVEFRARMAELGRRVAKAHGPARRTRRGPDAARPVRSAAAGRSGS